MSDDALTPVICERCSTHIPVLAGYCPKCGRHLTPAQTRRQSSLHIAFGDRARELSERLEARRGDAYLHLAREGRELQREFEEWAKIPPADETRAATISKLADWSLAALAMLTAER